MCNDYLTFYHVCHSSIVLSLPLSLLMNSIDSEALPLKAVVYNTLLSKGVNNSTLTSNCPTGNCTFDPFKTLGFCSTCKDITANITSHCEGNCSMYKATEWVQDCSYPGPNTTNSWHDSDGALQFLLMESTCNYTVLPRENAGTNETSFGAQSGSLLPLSLNSGYQYPEPQSVPTWWGTNMSTAALSTVEDECLMTSFVGQGSPLLVFGRAVLGSTLLSASNPTGIDIVPTVASCAMSMCVQTLRTTVRNGVLHQERLSTWQNDSIVDTPHIPRDLYLNSPPSTNITGPARNSTFFVAGNAYSTLLSLLEKVLNSNATSTDPEMGDSGLAFDSDIGAALWSTRDLNSIMDPLADRLTDWLRTQPNNEPFVGTAYRVEVHVSVNWYWLVLPVSLVLLSYTLLIAAMVSSTKQHTIAWKSNSLATLFHGLPIANQQTSNSTFPRQMNKAAEQMHVQLENDDSSNLQLVPLQILEQAGSQSSSSFSMKFPDWPSNRRRQILRTTTS